MFFTMAHPAALRRSPLPTTLRSLDRILAPCQPTRATAGQANVRFTTAKDADQAWTLSLDVPGVSKTQLLIGIEGQVVRVQTSTDAPRQYQSAYELPQYIDPSTSVAKLEHGVLTLTLSKKKPASNSTRITIN
jgi:HSP20 family molecular chaperone IbpA